MKNREVFLFLCITLIIILPVVLLYGCSPEAEEPSVSTTDGTEGDTAFSFGEGLDENGFWEGINALDYVEIFNYQALPIPSEIHQISDEALQAEIDYLLSDYSSANQIMDRAVVDGDTVNIDFVGSADGVEFEGGSTGGQGTDVTIGVTNYIDDFLEQLIGHEPGETIDVEVTFPDDYFEETLRGQDALFVTTINYIIEEVPAELNDDFVAENFLYIYGWATVEEMQDHIRMDLQASAIQRYIEQYFVTQVVVQSIPEQLIEYQVKAMLQSYQEYAGYYNMSLEEFISNSEGFSSVDELIESYNEDNVSSATFYLVAQAVAEDAGMSVGDEDLEEFFFNNFGSADYSSYEEQFGLPYLKQVVLCQKVIDYVTENAVFL